MAIIRHFEATPEEREAYLKQRRLMAGAVEDDAEADEDEETVNAALGQLSTERYAEMSAAEDLILTITAGGSGKLSSSHGYPVRGRGGMGVKAMDGAMRGGKLVASFPVEMSDQIMLATPPASRSASRGPDQLPLPLCRWRKGVQRRRG